MCTELHMYGPKYPGNIINFIIISYNNNYTLKKYSYSPTSNDY